MKVNDVGEPSLLEVLYSRRGSCCRPTGLVVLKTVMDRNAKEWHLILFCCTKFTL